MSISIAELKKVCRPSKDLFVDKYFYRRLSIYCTWFLVRLPITANQVTILWIVVGVSSSILYTFGTHISFIIASFALQIQHILDCTDGEVARYHNATSHEGYYLDLIGHYMVNPLLLFGFGIGLYNCLGYRWLLYLGFFLSFFYLLNPLLIFTANNILLGELQKKHEANRELPLQSFSAYTFSSSRKKSLFWEILSRIFSLYPYPGLLYSALGFYATFLFGAIVDAILDLGFTINSHHIAKVMLLVFYNLAYFSIVALRLQKIVSGKWLTHWLESGKA